LLRDVCAIIVASIVCGALDASTVALRLFDARDGIDYVPGSLWVWCVAVWFSLGLIASLFLAALPEKLRALFQSLTITGFFCFLIAMRLIRPVSTSYPRTLLVIGVLACWLGSAFVLRRKPQREHGWPKRHALAVGFTVVVLVVVGVAISDSPAAEAALTVRRPPADAPNIVIVFLDTLRADTAKQMPALQRFLRRGAVFENAYAPAPWTLPSHISAMTGDSAAETGVSFEKQHYRDDASLPMVLGSSGYETAGVVANAFLNEGTGFTRGFKHYKIEGRTLDACRSAPLYELRRFWPAFQHSVCSASAETVVGDAAAAMSAPRSGPIFLVLNFTDAHDLYYAPGGCTRRARITPYDVYVLSHVLAGDRALDAERARRFRAAYDDAAQCLDRSLGALFAKIDALPGRITIVTADHGEHFGEHGLYLHGNSLFPELLHVPFGIVGSGVPAQQIEKEVSLTEIHDYVRHAVSERPIPSRLAGLIDGRPAWDEPPAAFLVDQSLAPKNFHPYAAVFDGGFEGIDRRSGRFELFDLRRDPQAMVDLADQPQYLPQRLALQDLLRKQKSRELGRRLAREQMKNVESLGYLR
jgi:arylsulfatase A-like enzyme